MKYSEHLGNLWDVADGFGKWKVITINVYVKKNGELVMGRGIAYEATKKYTGIAYALGQKIKEIAKQEIPENQLYVNLKHRLIALPVKRFWNDQADLKLIEENLQKLAILGNYLFTHGLGTIIYLPRPGCGNGHRDWNTEVKPLADKYLNDELFVVCHKKTSF